MNTRWPWLAFILAACAHPAEEPSRPGFDVRGNVIHVDPTVASPVRFQTIAVRPQVHLDAPSVTARVTTVDALTAPSFAPLDGHVVEVAVHLGDVVEKGARLVEVRTADLANLQHELRAAKLTAVTRQSIVERTRQLVEARAASQNDLTVAESQLAEAQFSSQAAAARLNSLSVRIDGDTSYWVLASRAGVVVALDAVPGKQVGPGQEKPVAIVADLDEVWVLGDVPQRDATGLRVGLRAEVSMPGRSGILASGVIETVVDVVDAERQTVPVRVRVPNQTRALRPNAYVNVTFANKDEQQVLRLPSAAVVSDGAASVVFVQATGGSFERRQVETGYQTRDQVEIVRGLAAGEKVVVSGALLLLNALQMEG